MTFSHITACLAFINIFTLVVAFTTYAAMERLGLRSRPALLMMLLMMLTMAPRCAEATVLPFIGYYDVFPEPYDVLQTFTPVSATRWWTGTTGRFSHR